MTTSTTTKLTTEEMDKLGAFVSHQILLGWLDDFHDNIKEQDFEMFFWDYKTKTSSLPDDQIEQLQDYLLDNLDKFGYGSSFNGSEEKWD